MKQLSSLVMFGMIWAMLLCGLRAPMRTASLQALADSVNEHALRKHVANIRMQDQFRDALLRRTNDLDSVHFIRPLAEMQSMLNVFQEIETGLRSLESQLRQIRNQHSRISRNESERLAGAIHQLVRRTSTFPILAAYDTGYLRSIVKQSIPPGLTELSPSIVGPSGGAIESIRHLFAGRRVVHGLVTVICIRDAMAEFETQMLWSLFRDYAGGCILHFDAITAIAYPERSLFLPGERITGRIIVAEYDRQHRILSASATTGTLRVEDNVVTWKGRSPECGRQQVSGELRYVDRERGDTATYPWQFRYITIPSHVRLTLGATPYLEAGTGNAVSIDGVGRYPMSSLDVAATGAAVSSVGNGRYSLRPDNGVTLVTMRLLFSHGSQVDTLEQRLVPVRAVATPNVGVRADSDADLSVAGFQAASGLKVQGGDADVSPGFSIESFVLKIETTKGDSVGEYTFNGAAFDGNPQAIPVLDNLRKGDRLFIESILLRDRNGAIHHASDRYIRLR